jgi:DNA-binding response OmpR family regulator
MKPKILVVDDEPEVLDLMMPEMDGLEVCKVLRREPTLVNTPVLMLTAKAAEIDRVLGLELGASDYVTKPFSMRELLLRVKNFLQRPVSASSTSSKPDSYHVGELSLDLPRHQLAISGVPIELTATEFRLLTILLERRGRVQSRDQLLQDVWNYENVIDTRTVDTHMRRLRQKLGPAARFVETVRGVGYRFSTESS